MIQLYIGHAPCAHRARTIISKNMHSRVAIEFGRKVRRVLMHLEQLDHRLNARMLDVDANGERHAHNAATK